MDYEGSVTLFYWQYSLLSKGRMDREHEYLVSFFHDRRKTVSTPLSHRGLRWYGIINAIEKHGPSCAFLCTVHSLDCDPIQDSPQCSARYCLTRNHTEAVLILEGKHA